MHDLIKIVYDGDYDHPYVYGVYAESTEHVYFHNLDMHDEHLRFLKKERKLEIFSRDGKWIPHSEKNELSQVLIYNWIDSRRAMEEKDGKSF